MVDVVQLVERQFVVLVVVGSSPIVHPILNLNVTKWQSFNFGILRLKLYRFKQYGLLAQLVEHMTFNHGVRGSIPR